MTHDLTAAAVLFDMDGTLVDSTAVVERTWHAFADQHGLDTAEILGVSHGRPTKATVAHFLADPDMVAAETEWLVALEVSDTRGVVAVPGAAALLAALPAGSWALVTSAGRALAEKRMAAAGLDLPPVVVTSDDVTAGKPDPQGYLRAAEALGVRAEDAVVFEDADAGLRAGIASGAAVVVVGGHDGPATAGLPRVPDLRAVAAHVNEGRIHLRLRTAAATH